DGHVTGVQTCALPIFVETTNFRPEATFRNANPKSLKITERFKRISADQIEYSFTIDDPSTWTKPWTAIVPLKATQGPFFEYACRSEEHTSELQSRGHL